MPSEKEVIRHFNKYKKKFIKQLGTKATSSEQLTKIGKQEFGKKYIGTFPQNHKIPRKKGTQYYIINNHMTNQPGEHWIGIISTPNNIFYIYDSFARSSKKLIPYFIKGKIIIESERDPEQFGNTEVCGPLCLAWLKCAQELGIRNALKI